MRLRYLFSLTLLLFCIATGFVSPSDGYWKSIDIGLDWGQFRSSSAKYSKVDLYILRIDSKVYRFTLMMASDKKHSALTMATWCQRYRLLAAINASMYLPDGVKSTGYMVDFNSSNNRRLNRQFGAFIVFNPKSPKQQPIRLIDRYTQNWRELIDRYHTVIQNYRIVDTNRRIVWKEDGKKSSIAAFGTDSGNRVLFILCQGRISTNQFARRLLALPIALHNLSYLEGGHEAVLQVTHPKLSVEIRGKSLLNHIQRNPLPNIIAIRKK